MHEILKKFEINRTILAKPGSPSRVWNDAGLGLAI